MPSVAKRAADMDDRPAGGAKFDRRRLSRMLEVRGKVPDQASFIL